MGGTRGGLQGGLRRLQWQRRRRAHGQQRQLLQYVGSRPRQLGTQLRRGTFRWLVVRFLFLGLSERSLPWPGDRGFFLDWHRVGSVEGTKLLHAKLPHVGATERVTQLVLVQHGWKNTDRTPAHRPQQTLAMHERDVRRGGRIMRDPRYSNITGFL